jgi:hypothetical protein
MSNFLHKLSADKWLIAAIEKVARARKVKPEALIHDFINSELKKII